MRQKLLRAIVIVGACALAACKDTSDPGGTPTTIDIVAAAPATGVVNSAVSPGPSFVVKNQNGDPMKAAVTIAVTAGGGTLAGQPAQSNVGTTGIGTWTLGRTVATNIVTVTAGSLAPITFSVTSTPAAPQQVTEVNAPATQRSALANAVVATPIIVAVADTFGNAIAGQTVTFSITAGGGTLIGAATATTAANGQATAPSWQLGKRANAQTLRAISGALNPKDVSATVTTNFNVVVRFFEATAMTVAQQALFTNAAQRIMGVITGDVANVQFTNIDVSSCLAQTAGTTVINETVDDVVVYATIKDIDGPGQVLASAGFCYFRTGAGCAVGCDKVPLLGVMRFDVADIGSLSGGGSLEEVIMHEMLHVVGVGSLWRGDYLNFISGAGTLDPRYTALEARLGCLAVGGLTSCASTVPAEGCADRPFCQAPNGGGTRDSHWREATFGTELMTGFINASPNPFSSLTIGGLKDIGYVVNAGNFDGYVITAGSIMANSLGAVAPAALLSANWERLNHLDVYSVDRGGNVRLVRKAQ